MSEHARRVILSVTIAGHDVAGAFAPYLLDFTYKDNIGGKSDEVQITLHNRDGRFSGEWALKKGLPVTAAIVCRDWEGPGQDLSLPCGAFKIDEIEFSGPPDKISIKAVSADLTSQLRDTRKTRAWENTSLSGVAGQIAGENGLALFYSGPDHPFERQDQRNESDISFLNRIALDRGFHCKVHNGKLALFDAEQAESAGASLVIPKKEDIYSPTSYRFRISSSQTAYSGGKVAYTDPKTGQTHMAEVRSGKQPEGGSGKNLTLQERVESAGQAITLGRARLHNENMKEETVSLETMGCPKIAAGQTVELEGFGTFSGVYSVKTATHKVGGSGGYTTSLELTAPAPTAGVSAYDTVLGENEPSSGASSGTGNGPGASQGSAAADRNASANRQAKEAFDALLPAFPDAITDIDAILAMLPDLAPEDIPDVNELLLCLPDIAAKEAARQKSGEDRTGWELLQNFFYRWFSGKANDDAFKNPEPYYIDLDWVLGFTRASNAHERLKDTILNEKAKEALSKTLKQNNLLTDKIEFFDFTNKSPADWRKFYHQHSAVEQSGANGVDGLTAALGGFNFYGFAKGWVEPLPGGGHRIHVTGTSTALQDSFNFEGEQPLGFWNYEDKEFTLNPFNGDYLDNYVFRQFRENYGYGKDFIIITEPSPIERFEEVIYDTSL